MLPVVHALSAVHDSGVVHRDIKPENVLLAEVELGLQAKLLDFGISRKTDRVRRLTVRDTALGTPDYMSPEQARGETSDAHTDQWSFCVVLYEAITKNRPFEADNYNALLRAIIEDAPKPLTGLRDRRARAVADPDPRPRQSRRAIALRSIRDLGEALALWLLDRGVTEDSVGTSLRRAWLKEASSGAYPAVKDVASRPSKPHPRLPRPRLERASTQMQEPAAAQAPPTTHPRRSRCGFARQ